MTPHHALLRYHQRGATAILLIVELSALTIEGAPIGFIREGSANLLERLRGTLDIVSPSVIISEVMIVCNLE